MRRGGGRSCVGPACERRKTGALRVMTLRPWWKAEERRAALSQSAWRFYAHLTIGKEIFGLSESLSLLPAATKLLRFS